MNEKCREAFQEWIAKEYSFLSLELWGYDGRTYTDLATDLAWKSWIARPSAKDMSHEATVYDDDDQFEGIIDLWLQENGEPYLPKHDELVKRLKEASHG